jgi:hypothetical protein
LFPRLVATSALCALATLCLARCAGCSEECGGKNAGAEGCPCASDQDCTTRLGSVLLCVDGNCQVGDPEDVFTGLDECGVDGDCAAGEACGADGFCEPAPACQRIEIDLKARRGVEPLVNVTRALDGCSHTWSVVGAWSADFEIDLGGDIAFSAGACTAGSWRAGSRFGTLTCDGETWVVGPEDAIADVCVLDGGVVGACP